MRAASLRSAFRTFLALAIVFAAFVLPAQARSKYAAMVVDGYNGKVIYSRNADARRFPASLTKIMTLYILFGELEAGRLSKSTGMKVSKKASRQPPSKLGLKAGSTISVDNAIRALVTKSANDVALVIAERISGSEAKFAKRMTQTARAMGMARSQFRNASGLPNASQWTTARDMATLARRVMSDYPKYYKYFSLRRFTWRGRKYGNHNKLLGRYKGTTGIKTGYTRASGFNLTAAVKRGGKQLVAVVMGGKTGRIRDAEMRRILDRSFPRVAARRGQPKRLAKPRALAKLLRQTKPATVARTAIAKAPTRPESSVVRLALVRLPARNRELPLAATQARPHRGAGQFAANQSSQFNNSTIAGLVGTSNQLYPPRNLFGASPTAERTRRLASLGAVQPIAYAPVAQPRLASVSIEQLIMASRAVVAARQVAPAVAAPIPVKRSRIVRPASARVAVVAPAPAGFSETTGPDPAASSQARRALFAAAAKAERSFAQPPITPAALAAPAAPVAPVAPVAPAALAAPAALVLPSGWQIQVGAYAIKDDAEARLGTARKAAGRALSKAMGFAIEVQKPGGTIYRARFAGLKPSTAKSACRALKRRRIACLVVAN
ncbi:MAG: serine hydrolase [Alphaproteobacteria bacterium]